VCEHCGTSLEVKREGGVMFVELVEHLAKVEGKLDSLKIEQELARVDREWELERRALVLRGEHGNEVVPRQGSAIGIAVTAALGGAGLTFFSARLASPGVLVITLGPLLAIVGIGMAFWLSNKAAVYTERECEYRSRRADIERKLRGSGQSQKASSTREAPAKSTTGDEAQRPCPKCGGLIHAKATTCMHCWTKLSVRTE